MRYGTQVFLAGVQSVPVNQTIVVHQTRIYHYVRLHVTGAMAEGIVISKYHPKPVGNDGEPDQSGDNGSAEQSGRNWVGHNEQASQTAQNTANDQPCTGFSVCPRIPSMMLKIPSTIQ
jgi:hypothetical protein